MRCWLLMAVCVAMSANAQRPNDGATCDAGTPIPFTENGVWGYVTTNGIAIPPRFTSASPFSSGVAAVCTSEGCGLINIRGQFITPLRDRAAANLAGRYSEGVGVLWRNGKWGYVDLAGNIVIPLMFQYAGDFDKGMAKVKLNEKSFFINRRGERITPEFDGVFEFSEDLAAVVVGGKVGYIKRDGDFALHPIYQGTSGIDFSEGLVAVRIDGKVGFIDHSGAIVVKPAYDDAYPFSEGRAMVRLGESWGYIDKNGKMVISPLYRIAHMFNEGVASVSLADTGKWGYIDRTGAFAIPPVFDAAMPFCAGLAHVETSRKIGRDPSSLCRTDRYQGKKGIINHSGNYVWRDSMERLWNGHACF